MLYLCHGWEVPECPVSAPWQGGALPRAFYLSSVKGGACPWVFDLSPSQRDSSLGATSLIPEGGFVAPQKFFATHWVTAGSLQQELDFNPFGGEYFPLTFPLSPGEDFSLGTLFQPSYGTLSWVFMAVLEEEVSLGTLTQLCSSRAFLGSCYLSPGGGISLGALTVLGVVLSLECSF